MLPVAAVANFYVQFQYLGMEFLPQIIATTLFLLVLPLQGYYWLESAVTKYYHRH